MLPLKLGSFTVVLSGVGVESARGAVGWASVALNEEHGRRTLLDCGGRADAVVLRRALERLGIAPDQIDAIVLSHLHFDHAGGLAFYPAAEIVVSEDELEHARRSREDPWRDAAVAVAITDELAARKARTVRDGDHVGSLTVIELPGHTPGSIGLVDRAGVLFAGDAAKNLSEVVTGISRSAVDMTRAAESITKLRGASYTAVIPGHDRPFACTPDTVTPLASLRLVLRVPDVAGSQPPGDLVIDLGSGDPAYVGME